VLLDLYLDHLVFRARDLSETRLFWDALLGCTTMTNHDSLMFVIGGTRLFFTQSACNDPKTYDKERLGLNHLAFGVRYPDRLRNLLRHLEETKIQNGGIQVDHYGEKEFIWLDDPNGFRIEFYCRPE
jgi:glyoxylase I family protein